MTPPHPHRVGKIKVFTEEGKLIREGHSREGDFEGQTKKIFGMFAPAEIIRSGFLTVAIVFSAGGLWADLNNHFKTEDDHMATFVQSFNEFKMDSDSFHKVIFQKFDDKEKRINCVAENLTACCRNAKNC